MNKLKELYEELDLYTGTWWIFHIFTFLIFPIYKVYSGTLSIDGEVIESPWWVYLLAIFVWDWFVIIFLTSLALIGMVLSKVHNYFSSNKG